MARVSRSTMDDMADSEAVIQEVEASRLTLYWSTSFQESRLRRMVTA